MKCELIIIGSEILSGNTSEANGKWLGLKLRTLGIPLVRMTVIADEEGEILRAFEESFQRSEVIFTCGGLGPTKDDLTKKVLAKFFQGELKPSKEAEEIAKQNYQRFGREFTPETNFYHVIPEGISACTNPCGLAPGLVRIDRQKKKMFFCAPGVPREFACMVDEVFIPEIRSLFKAENDPIEFFKIRTFGIPEEKIFFELCPGLWENLERYGSVSSLPQTIGVDIVISFRPEKISREKIYQDFINSPYYLELKSYIWQIGELQAEEYVAKLCREKKLTLALAESCTGGYLANLFTNISGISDIFLGSAVTYSNFAKESLINVKAKSIKNDGAVSEIVAEAMAFGAMEKFKSEISVSLTGIAGPSGGSPDKPVGMVCIAIAQKNHKIKVSTHYLKGDRLKLKERFAQRALLDLISYIEERS